MKINFKKNKDGLVPAVIQDINTSKVLMLGYMNKEALDRTLSTGKVTFFSRTKQRLWTKGEQSGNFLKFESVKTDCDSDALLVKAAPTGAVCHKGSDTCWEEENKVGYGFLSQLEAIISERREANSDKSYVASLFRKGINAIAQKVGEEAVETVIESKDDDDRKFLDESADLLFHLIILLQARGYSLNAVAEVLASRHTKT
jgi:phosphoribosyl-ATP pyrophosphohydrolase/phosphoribosyl-AMP cyclohydrolase